MARDARIPLAWMAAMLALACPGPAQALEACFAASTGEWTGPVLSGGHIAMMDVEFHADPGGGLAGRYLVHDRDPYGGALTGFRRTGACKAEFDWTDKYGEGVVDIRFEPELGQFLGLWGVVRPMYEHVFDGFRHRPDVES